MPSTPGAPPTAQAAPRRRRPAPARLTADELAHAPLTAAALRELLRPRADLGGGTPIRLLKASWLLEWFEAAGNEGARLEHRQALERAHGDAPFVTGDMLERVLAEVERGEYVTKVDGEYRSITNKWGESISIAFPSSASASYMWLDPAHPDPQARTLRELWLPAIQWYFSERVRQLTTSMAASIAPKTRRGAPSDAAVRAGADFGLFVDLASMCQRRAACATS